MKTIVGAGEYGGVEVCRLSAFARDPEAVIDRAKEIGPIVITRHGRFLFLVEPIDGERIENQAIAGLEDQFTDDTSGNSDLLT